MIGDIYPYLRENRFLLLEDLDKINGGEVSSICWFCEKNPAEQGAEAEVPLHRRIGSEDENIITYLRRCSRCKAVHNRMEGRVGLGAVTGAVVGFLASIVTFYSLSLWSEGFTTYIGIFAVGMVGFGMLGGLIAWLVGRWLTPKDIKDQSRRAEHPDLRKLAASGWIVGVRPPQLDIERKTKDPMAALKVGGRELNHYLINTLKDRKGVHIESLLTALGSLAGFSCQMSIREELIESGKVPENSAFVIAEGTDGKRYYFGDLLNAPLAENQYSIWDLSGGAAQHLGCTSLPNLEEIFEHVAETVGGESFGIPRVPDNHRANDLPINYVKSLWPKILPIIRPFCRKPSEWPTLFGLAIQEVIFMEKDTIDPKLAVTIVMESAIPMSKVDLTTP
jgi:hypothetical protein